MRLASLLLIALPWSAFSQQPPVPERLKESLRKQIRLSDEDLKKLGSGRAVAGLLDTEGDEIGAMGAVFVNVPPKYLFDAYSQVDKLKPGDALLFGRFSKPARAADLGQLTIDDEDLRELRRCKPGDCELLLPDSVLERFSTGFDWNAPDATARANALFREALAGYMNAYREKGDDALLTYHNRKNAESMKAGFRELVKHTPALYTGLPELIAHMERYPKSKPADTEDYLVWAKTVMDRNVIRADHLMVHREKGPGGNLYVFAVKNLFATRHMRDGLQMRILVPATEGAEPKAAYLLGFERMHLDDLTTMKGKMVARAMKGRLVKSSVQFLEDFKKVIEEWYRANAKPGGL